MKVVELDLILFLKILNDFSKFVQLLNLIEVLNKQKLL